MANRRLTDAINVQNHGRSLFKQAIRRATPEVLDTLRNELLSVFEQAKPDLSDKEDPFRICGPSESGSWFQPEYDVRRLGEQSTSVRALHEGLEGWAQMYNLKDRWLKDAALRVLLAWSLGQVDSLWDTFDELPDLDIPVTLEFTTSAWNCTKEPFSGFERRVIAELKQELRKLKRNLPALATQAKLGVEPDFSSPHHFEWLAYYQVRNLSSRQVLQLNRRWKPFDLSTVEHAVRSTAKAIGLTLRPGMRGRQGRK